MQKVILYFALALFCLAAPKEETLSQSLQSGWFLGAGLGIGLENLKIEGSDAPTSTKNYASFLASAKVGRYHHFTQLFGLQYYYNLDLSFNPADPYSSPFSYYDGFFLITQTHTLNVDALFNVYSKGKHALSIISGLGLGLAVQDYSPRFETRYGFSSKSDDRFTVKFQTRINLGVRWMFEQKYGVEFLTKIPISPGMVMEGKKSLNPTKLTTHPFYFTLDFVMEL